jgi:hypothetical protein
MQDTYNKTEKPALMKVEHRIFISRFQRVLTMVYNTRDSWVFGLCPSSGILKNTTFRKLDLFPSAGKGWETPALLGPLERANLNHWSSIVYFRIPDDGQVQKSSNPNRDFYVLKQVCKYMSMTIHCF